MTEALDSRDQYTFFVPPDARWNTIRHLKEDVGAGVFVTGFVTRGSGLVLGALFGGGSNAVVAHGLEPVAR